jgi:heptosyltransferase I
VIQAGDRTDGARRFLIVRLGALGDVVHAIPVAAALRTRFPDARIDWLVDPRYAELLQLVSGIDALVPVDPRRGLRPLYSTILRLRRARYDAVLDLQGLLKSSVLARLAGAKITIGFPRVHLREPMARVFYSHAPDPGPATHVVHKNLALLEAVDVHDRRPYFPLDVPTTEAAERLLARHGERGYALINPGAAWPNKRWRPERFGAAADAIRQWVGVASVVLWGPGEHALAEAVVASSSGAAELAPPTSIVDICAIARGAKVMLSGDTGPLHLAAAVGTPVVALFGPTCAERNGPWNAVDVVVSRTDQCDCRYERRCRRSARHQGSHTSPEARAGASASGFDQIARPCMEEIGVEDVVAAIVRRVTSRG